MSKSFIMKRVHKTEFFCTNCGHREEQSGMDMKTRECPYCNMQNFEKRKLGDAMAVEA